MRTIVAFLLVIVVAGCTSTPGPDPGGRVQHWIEQLKAREAKERKEAAFRLGNLGQANPGLVVPALTDALKDADAAIRRESILALVKCGPAAKSAFDALTELERKDRDATVRAHAAKAVARLKDL